MKTRERILQTAVKLFNEQGISQVGVRDIARALEISPGNMSYHFPKKEDLIAAIMVQYSNENDLYYEFFFKGPCTLGAYLATLEQVFFNQFRHRGILLGLEELRKFFAEHYNYAATHEKRMATTRVILNRLLDAGELQMPPADLEFLRAFIGLFGRFWILEAFYSSNAVPDAGSVVRHYLQLASHQFSLFATDKGKNSINLFWNEDRIQHEKTGSSH